MMPQRETGNSIHEQTDSTYGRYEGEQAYAQQSYEPSFEDRLKDGPGEKVYPAMPANKNMFRLIIFFTAMVMILVCAFLFIFFMGGTGGWISFAVAAGVIFLISTVTMEKIQ